MNKWVVLASIVLCVLLGGAGAAQTGPADILSRVDHLVYATRDLNVGIDRLEQLLGVRAVSGGPHPGGGTRNALIALGPTTYLEIVGRDPEQPEPKSPRPFGIDHITEPKLVAWVANGTALEQLVLQATRAGVKLGEVIPGNRQRPDGVLLAWRYTNPETVEGGPACAVLHRLGNEPASGPHRGSRRVPRRSACGTSRPGTNRAHAGSARPGASRPEGTQALGNRNARRAEGPGGTTILTNAMTGRARTGRDGRRAGQRRARRREATGWPARERRAH